MRGCVLHWPTTWWEYDVFVMVLDGMCVGRVIGQELVDRPTDRPTGSCCLPYVALYVLVDFPQLFLLPPSLT